MGYLRPVTPTQLYIFHEFALVNNLEKGWSCQLMKFVYKFTGLGDYKEVQIREYTFVR